MRERKICIVGLGYVGLPLATAFGKKQEVVGFDTNKERIASLLQGVDWNNEVEPEELKSASIRFTADPSTLRQADFFIVAVPTPVKEDNQPDLAILKSASEIVGRHLSKGAIVVYESTVYPGATEEVCAPILERESGLVCGKDFKVGYSPERINPGDKEHTLERITKIVAGMDEESLKIIAKVYESVIKAGVYRAESIKVAEAAKVIENTQRDLNISLMNELKMIFDKLGIDTNAVLEAAGTKWNFLPFHPGLVGGHCIGVDPYYLAYKAKFVGHHPEIILAGRRINDEMAVYEARRIVKHLIKKGYELQGLKLLILGATFKPNVKDLRNSKVEVLAKELESYGLKIAIHEPLVEEQTIFGYQNLSLDQAKKEGYEHAVLAVKHDCYEALDDFSTITLF